MFNGRICHHYNNRLKNNKQNKKNAWFCYIVAANTSINTKQKYQNEYIPPFSSKHAKIARLKFYDETFSTSTNVNEKIILFTLHDVM